MTRTNKAISLSSIILIASLSSCAWFKANSTALSADALSTVECVVSSALAGNPVELIGCGIAAVEDVVKLLDSAHVVPVPSPVLSRIRARQMAVRAAKAGGAK
jgi:hypothetical protein